MTLRRHFMVRLPGIRWHAIRVGAATLASVGLAGCLSPARPYLDMDRRLSDAGFVAHKADTTARYAMMNTLPPGALTYRPSSVGPVYLYADPIGCGCVYMGSATAYSYYLSAVDAGKRRRRSVPAASAIPAMTAENRRDTAEWDWSAWSPNADPGPTQPRHVIGGYW
ncbi:hypothetical protein ACLRDC_11760 [Gluconacetobacter sacchari]|uniref:Lipoprotein n=1 Tax=Gluconacetobacter sacchari DSM 12717 TaxID=1307940 RepID=A0ABQ0P217_9PROT|nr:hypothetical protein [Gluconacetobacter sacchari]GBQ18863.1 hypothetical protein AA12717_0059 [Gluconacetobacter sacchari DSM 12717]